jgi:hypothetical protein
MMESLLGEAEAISYPYSFMARLFIFSVAIWGWNKLPPQIDSGII